jgi:hypothetical protein
VRIRCAEPLLFSPIAVEKVPIMPAHTIQRRRAEIIAQRGLRLPKVTLEWVKDSGISCIPEVSVELQRSSRRYVIRSQESGGAISNFGIYCGYVNTDGTALSWLQRLDSLSVNGVHARAVSQTLVRVQVVRVRHTYDLLISRHSLASSDNKVRPHLASSIVFLGHQGTLELDLWDKDKALCGTVSPVFYHRSGEVAQIPLPFEHAVRRAVAGANCCGCDHVHLLEPPQASTPAPPEPPLNTGDGAQ